MKHRTAVLVLLAHLLLGTPGLDFMRPQDFDEPDEKAATLATQGPALGTLLIAAAWFDQRVRLPVYKVVAPIQRPIRARQSWHLYRDGPRAVQRLEVRVDGRLVHRSADPACTWRDAQLRNRRVRPVMQAVARRAGSPNWRGMIRYIVEAAREDFPDARRVTVTATSAPFPGTTPHARHSYRAEAPDWIPVERVETR